MSHLHASRQRTLFDHALSWIFGPAKAQQQITEVRVRQHIRAFRSHRSLATRVKLFAAKAFAGFATLSLLITSLACATILSPAALAQQQVEDNELEEIVVTATRIPTPLDDVLSTTTVITSEDIERIQPRDLGSLLSRKSGLSFRDSGGKGSAGGIFVRGTDEKHVLILIDGIRTSSATDGLTKIENIPLSSIDRIEIVKGPMSGIYGADAIGGVIQIFTKSGPHNGDSGSVSVSNATNRSREYSGQAGFGTNGHSLFLSATKESTDGIDRTKFKGGGNEDKDGFERSSGNMSLSTYLQDDLELNFRHLSSIAKIDYDNVTYRPGKSRDRAVRGENWHQRKELTITSAQIDYAYSSNLNFLTSIGYSTDYRRDFTNRRDHFKTHKYDYSIQSNWTASPRNQISFGIDYQRDKIDSNSDYTTKERTNKAYYTLWQHDQDRSTTVINIRHERNDNYSADSYYNFQQSFSLTESHQIITSYGTAFRAPSLNDLYFKTTYGLNGNPKLKPEESESLELSFRSNDDDQSWQINLYRTKLKNLIMWPKIGQPTNVNKATLEGIEFEFTKEWSEYIVGASFDYLEAYNDENRTFLPDRARASATLEAGRQIENLYIGIDAFAEHGRHDGGNTLPGYGLWGLSLDYEISDSFSVSSHINNLFDKNYVINVAEGNNPYQNEGRTIRVSLEYRF